MRTAREEKKNLKIEHKSQKETQLFLLQKLLGAVTQTPGAPSPALSLPHFPGQAKPARIHHHLREEWDQNISSIDVLLPFFAIDSLIKKE